MTMEGVGETRDVCVCVGGRRREILAQQEPEDGLEVQGGCPGLPCTQSQATDLLSSDPPDFPRGVWEQEKEQRWDAGCDCLCGAGAGGGEGSVKDRGGHPPKRTTHRPTDCHRRSDVRPEPGARPGRGRSPQSPARQRKHHGKRSEPATLLLVAAAGKSSMTVAVGG